MRAPRRFPAILPGNNGVPLGRLRREALEQLAAEARGLHGNALRVYVFRTRAVLGSDLALELAVSLADRKP